MKIKIDKQGQLYIKRAGKFKAQYCPHTVVVREEYVDMSTCGDWCPLFNEPESTGNKILIELCENVLEIKKDKFIDERSK